MKINKMEIKIKDIASGYINSDETGVFAYKGKLNIRPIYQREFVYNDAQAKEVIKTVFKNFPLNIFYWVKNGDSYEVLDGQQRTMSIMEYIDGNIKVNERYFHNLTKQEQDVFLNYKLSVYICEGKEKEKLDWFKIINIAGEKLTTQELRNAVYPGQGTTAAKKYFSKRNCRAEKVGKDYMTGSPIRQEYFETALKWISIKQNKTLEDYMAHLQHKDNANELWGHFENIINWIKRTLTIKRSEMKSVDWGQIYKIKGDKEYSPIELEEKISKLMEDEDVSNKKGIYTYIFDGDERHLSIRKFSDKDRRTVYEEQKHLCNYCKKKFTLNDMHADHIIPWSKGGKTTKENCQMLCVKCNLTKSDK